MNKSLLMSFVLALICVSASGQSEDDIKKQVAQFFRAASDQSAGLIAEAEKTTALGAPVIPFLSEGLAQRSEQEVVWGIRCLKVLHSETSGDLLQEFCSSDLAAVRVEAIIALSALHPDLAPPIARKLMADKELQVRRRAIDALLNLCPGDEATIRIATQALTESDFWVCGRAIRLLSRMDYKSDKERLVLVQDCMALLPKLSPQTAQQVVGLVTSKAHQQSLPFLVAALNRDVPSLQTASLNAAAQLKLGELVDGAQLHLRDQDLKLRIASINYLATVRDRSSLRFLVDIIEVENDPAREAAAVGLRRISGRTYGYDVALWRKYIIESEDSRN